MRDWQEFWSQHKNLEQGVYGPPNKKLLYPAQQLIEGTSNLRALDVASGDGRYTISLAEMGYQVNAVDISSSALEQLRRRVVHSNAVNRITYEVLDITKPPREARNYDLVMCSGLIEELPIAAHVALIRCLQGWTSSGGIHILRYVTEKRLALSSDGDVVVEHNNLRQLYDEWEIIDDGEELNFRQATVGRVIDGEYVRRYFKAANIIAKKR